MVTYHDLLREARAQVREVSAAEADVLRRRDAATLVDVREAAEWEQGHAAGAVLVSRSSIEQQIEAAVTDRNRPVILYCAGGVRSLFAAQSLQQLGYTDVRSMAGGFQAWKSGGHEWVAPATLSPEQQQRYSRHLLIPEVGRDGQQKLLEIARLGAGQLAHRLRSRSAH